MLHVVGDLYNIAAEVQKFDPRYFLALDPQEGKYKILECHRRWRQEGVHNGLPLYSFDDVWEECMSIDYIDATKEAPDMRIVYDLYKKDIWRYPGGPEAYYDDMMRADEKVQQKRDEQYADMVEYTARERHKYIVREYDGAPDFQTLY